MLLSEPDQIMFSRYYGRRDLLEDDGFWAAVLAVYKDRDIITPAVLDPLSVRVFMDSFECPAGSCGACCKDYAYTYLNRREIERISALGEAQAGLLRSHLVDYEGKRSIKGPCPFLVENACSVYRVRPNTCYFFPVQVLRHDKVTLNGTAREMMAVRVKCEPGVRALRAVFREAMRGKEEKVLLLPNLNIVPIQNPPMEVPDGTDSKSH